jgi:hypothetical protein
VPGACRFTKIPFAFVQTSRCFRQSAFTVETLRAARCWFVLKHLKFSNAHRANAIKNATLSPAASRNAIDLIVAID